MTKGKIAEQRQKDSTNPSVETATPTTKAQAAQKQVQQTPLYQSTASGLVWMKPTNNGPVSVELTNFTAEIVADIQKDDGVEVNRLYRIKANLGGKNLYFTILAERFAGMWWATDKMGAGAIVYPGKSEHARTAIQTLSSNTVKRKIFAHTGWRRINRLWVYLHSGGAIGKDGAVPGVEVDLPDTLARFVLPDPPSGAALKRAIRASVDFLKVGPERVTIPMFAAIWRAIIGDTDFSLYVDGPTGAGKTALSALAQQHFGRRLDARHLPGSWSSTGNALEGLAFAAKDALLVVDDFAPGGSQQDVQRSHREADRLLRAQGNHSGRLRMRADTTLRPTKPPRGLILSTGEDIPRGQSLRARILALALSPNDLYWPAVTACQHAADSGLFAQATAGFVQWLAGDYRSIKKGWVAKLHEKRKAMSGSAAHRRTPGIAAELLLGFGYFLVFARESGALTRGDANQLFAKARDVLNQVAAAQAEHQSATEPTRQFLELLAAAITSGRAHVADPNGEEPSTPAGWGWREDGNTIKTWRPQGHRIGWLEGNDLYLDAGAAYGEAQRMARDSGDSLPLTLHTLKRRLHENSLLASTETRGGQQRLEVRRKLQGQRRQVLHMHPSTLRAPLATKVAQVAPPQTSRK